jgi:antitoxin component of RelBE/YafQ-DinJ toxin-antitoxin module
MLDKIITLRLNSYLHSEIVCYCQKNGLTISNFIRDLLLNVIKNKQKT